jgi:Polyferredoxin
MKFNKLKGLRVLFALLFFIPILFYFINFTDKSSSAIGSLLKIQLIPAIMAGSWLLVAALLVLTLLFGRIYCSVICPAGILQDLVSRFSRRGKKRKKGKKKRWYSYHKPSNIVRYALLGVAFLLFFLGLNSVLSWLDPYSNFGRIASNLFGPLVILGNNALASGLMSLKNYSLYHVSIDYITILSFIGALVAFVVLAGLALFRGRLFCNTLCPVGGLLSLVSRYSFFRIQLGSECNACGNCERMCKSECIDSKSGIVDSSRCVNCFNCLSSCKKGSIKYAFSLPGGTKNKKNQQQQDSPEEIRSRRNFIATGATLLATSSILPAWANGKSKNKKIPLIPPGGQGLEPFTKKCTACHLCVVKCPSQVIRPAGLEYGFNYMLKPHVVYDKAYCNYECTICSEICPNGALQKLTKEEKVTTQVGYVHFEKDLCITYVDGTDCGACSEHCPTQAVKMVPYKDSLRVPEIDPTICVGCGGCEYICPVLPQKAIYIIANEEHKKVSKPIYEEVEEKEVDDFGF